MNCDDIQSHLSAYRDGEGSPKQRWQIRGHLRDCDSCRRKLERLESVCELLDDAPAPPPISDDFTLQVVARARQRIASDTEEHGDTGRRPPAPAWLVAAAAVLVVGVGSGLLAGPSMWNLDSSPSEQPETCLLVDYSSPAPPGSLADMYRDVDDPTVY